MFPSCVSFVHSRRPPPSRARPGRGVPSGHGNAPIAVSTCRDATRSRGGHRRILRKGPRASTACGVCRAMRGQVHKGIPAGRPLRIMPRDARSSPHGCPTREPLRSCRCGWQSRSTLGTAIRRRRGDHAPRVRTARCGGPCAAATCWRFSGCAGPPVEGTAAPAGASRRLHGRAAPCGTCAGNGGGACMRRFRSGEPQERSRSMAVAASSRLGPGRGQHCTRGP